MTNEELSHQAFQTYAAIGELTLKRKQLEQEIAVLDSKLSSLETHIIQLSKTEPKND